MSDDEMDITGGLPGGDGMDALKAELGGDDENESWAPQEVGQDKELSKDGGVVKKLLVRGEGWKTPDKGDEVSVHYVGTLLDGTQFDSSRDRNEPFKFTLGQGAVIKGWDVGVKTMTKGEKALLTCKPEYAYGDAGAGDKIPPGSTLQFEVELLSWKSIKDLGSDGGCIKTILTEGAGWEVPKPGDGVRVAFTVRPAEPAPADLALPDVADLPVVEYDRVKDAPLALATALVTMKKGERVSLALSDVDGKAYTAGLGGSVPPGTPCVVHLTLREVLKVEVIPDTGDAVTKKVLVPNDAQYERPNSCATVTIRLTGYLGAPRPAAAGGADQGVVYAPGDCFLPEKELTCRTDSEAVPDGLDRALMTMHAGETARVTVGPAFGYGAAGAAVDAETGVTLAVPGGATLVYDVTMVSFTKEKESWDLKDGAEKVAYAEAKKQDGNALFAAGKFRLADKRYTQALKMIEFDTSFTDAEKKASKVLKATLHSNAAACAIKRGDFRAAVLASGKALELDGGAVKARFRHAQALAGLGEFLDAERELRRILDVDPNHKEATKELVRVRKAVKDQNVKDAALFGKMFAAPKKPAVVAAEPVAAEPVAAAAEPMATA